MKPLSDRQTLVYEAIRRSIRERGLPPTLRELCAELGTSSTNGMSDHLQALERKGWIERGSGHSRAIKLIDRGVVDVSDLSPEERARVDALLAELRAGRAAA